ncbi:MAG: bifunctional riboflavin kinase/FAD synthetase [Oscillospiraceae bacterium]|nr:bifunctional riboflavin kinase/FAD synthetase [Oscillospiraceae bacterium]
MKEKCIYALGFFDGVHLGHQALLRACLTLAKENNCRAGVVTFATHPDGLVSGKTPELINTVEQRAQLLYGCGMDSVIALPFDKKLMTTHWSVFLTDLVEQGAAGFVCGSDFRFGAGGDGTARKLQGFCESRSLPCAIVPQQELDGVRVSSTHIRSLLAVGDVEEANRYLGHAHVLTGQVIAGKQLGRTIGVPTANLALPEGLVQPAFGVYACYIHVEGKKYKAVTNVGMRPTVDGDHVTVEPWILDFEGDLYGKTVSLEFRKFLRPEEKFPSLEALKQQIQKDAEKTKALL